jgi:hypothetical protein
MQLGGALGSAYNAYSAANAAKSAAGAAGSAGSAAGSAAADAALTAASPEASNLVAQIGTREAAQSAFTPSIMQSAYNAPDAFSNAASQQAANLPAPGTSIAAAGTQPAPLAGGTGINLQEPFSPGVSLFDPLSDGASKLPPSEFQSLVKRAAQKTGSALQGVGKFVADNKELVKMGGEALGAMYGPEAEQMDFRKSIYNRQIANLNNPVRLGTTGGR